MIALGRLGWSLRRTEQATGVRRETAGDYLRVAGIALRRPGGRGRHSPSKAAIDPITDSDGVDSKAAIEVITGSEGANPANSSKPATSVTTGFSGSIQADDSNPAIEVTTGFFAGSGPPGPVAGVHLAAAKPTGSGSSWSCRVAVTRRGSSRTWLTSMGSRAVREREAIRSQASRTGVARGSSDHRNAAWRGVPGGLRHRAVGT